MTSEQINIAIAKAVGWEFVDWGKNGLKIHAPIGYKCDNRPISHDCSMVLSRNGKMLEEAILDYSCFLPNYAGCLNAMHKVERGGWWQYADTYQSLLESITRKAGIRIWNATARQRAEAFLRTLDLWKD